MDNKKEKIVINEDYGLKFKPLINKIKERVKYLTRSHEKGIVNRKSKSSFSLRDDGNINMVASANAQYKLSANGKASEVSHESTTVTNRKNINADDIVVNNHKLNPQLYEMADMRSVLGSPDKAVGNLTMFSTVLVKAWEPTLKRYVLIRRLARVPIFSAELNTPDVHPDLAVETDLEKEFSDMAEIESMSDMFTDFNK